jgi:hypothetical protein
VREGQCPENKPQKVEFLIYTIPSIQFVENKIHFFFLLALNVIACKQEQQKQNILKKSVKV